MLSMPLLLVSLISACSAYIFYDPITSTSDPWSTSGSVSLATETGCPLTATCYSLDASASISKGIDTAGYSDIYMKFHITTTGYESTDFCWVLYSIDNGANYVEMNKYTTENAGDYRYIYFPADANDNNNFRIKFQNEADIVGEVCIIDVVTVYGTSPKNIPYPSSLLIFEDVATSNTADQWTWWGNYNGGGLDDNCLGTIGCDNCHCFMILGGTNYGSITKIISTAGYIHISVEFDIRTTGIDADEYCSAYYTNNGGGIWYEIDSFDFLNDGHRQYFLPQSCNENNQFGLGFSMKTSVNTEICYIDVIRVKGDLPTPSPTSSPTNPTMNPTVSPTTATPSSSPTKTTISPTTSIPTAIPSFLPTINPTYVPSFYPSTDPTNIPTKYPTFDPTVDPTVDPTNYPTNDPTTDPTNYPTNDPTTDPTTDPTMEPTAEPTNDPTTDPTYIPTMNPTFTYNPTIDPTKAPSGQPTPSPTLPTTEPTSNPSEPNGQVLEKTSTTTVNNDNPGNDKGNQGQSENMLGTDNSFMVLLIIIIVALCLLLTCIAICTCYRMYSYVQKSKIRQTLEKNGNDTVELQQTDGHNYRKKAKKTANKLVKVSSLSTDNAVISQNETLGNVPVQILGNVPVQTSMDSNITDDKAGLRSSIYDDSSSEDLYIGDNNKCTEGNINNGNVNGTETPTVDVKAMGNKQYGTEM